MLDPNRLLLEFWCYFSHLDAHFQTTKLEKAEVKLAESEAEFESKMSDQKSSMSEQLKSHAESIQILVMEKTDLEGLLSKTQVALSNKDDHISDLQGDLDAARHKIDSLEAARVNTGSVDRYVDAKI